LEVLHGGMRRITIYRTFYTYPIRIRKTIGSLLPSVANPACFSRIQDPDFNLSWIPDIGSRIQQEQKQREKKNFCHKLHKI
jgi:hypothetical protein